MTKVTSVGSEAAVNEHARAILPAAAQVVSRFGGGSPRRLHWVLHT